MRERCRRFPVVFFSFGRHGGKEKEKEEGETDEADMFHPWIFSLVFLFAFLPFVQEPVVWQRQGSMFFVLKTVEVPQWSFQSWKCSGTIFSSMCAQLCLRIVLVCSRSRRCCACRGNLGCFVCALTETFITIPLKTQFERFRGFLELITRF